MQEGKPQTSYQAKDYVKFIIPSIIGIFLFMIPLTYDGGITIPVALMAGWVETKFIDVLPAFMTFVIAVTFVLSLITKVAKPSYIMNSPFFKGLFDVGPFVMTARGLAALYVFFVLFKIGPEWIWSDATGGFLLNDLIPTLTAVFLFAGLFLPLLLNFGLLEFVGALLIKLMRPVFTLPGRSAIDCLASWVGDGTIGVVLTNKQYEDGYYTKREGAVIGTTFSVVSITFTIVVLAKLNLEQYFPQYYLTIALAGLAAALITPRIPPLSRKKDTYYEHVEEIGDETIPKETSVVKWGLTQATAQARKVTGIQPVVKGGVQSVLDMWMGVIPVVMAIGTTAVIIAEFTPVFTWLGTPFVPILQLLQIPEAAAAAETMVVGFADMFLPAIIGSGIESDMTRFVIACVSVTQLIYMSEVGGLLLGSKLPVDFKDLVIIFLERTLITLPVIALMAHIIF